MSESSKSVAKSISVLSIAGILCKVIGLLFSIPLNMISPRVAGLFYLVYPTYTLLLTVSSAGLPVAVSRMVAGFLARNDPASAKKIFRCPDHASVYRRRLLPDHGAFQSAPGRYRGP